jgi:hypothetical protein
MIHSSKTNVKPEQKLTSKPEADNYQVSASIANALLQF